MEVRESSTVNNSPASNDGENDIPGTIWIDVDEVWVTERTPWMILKVSSTMRSSENQTKAVPQWIEPTMISIGPYHFEAMSSHVKQKLKTMHATRFIAESGQERNRLFRIIKGRMANLKRRYDINNDIGDNDLAAIFLVDGCFLLNFINYNEEENRFNELRLTNIEMVGIKRDVFLLENQLPYELLNLLLENARNNYRERMMEEKIRKFVASHAPFPLGISVTRENPNFPYHHLLHHLQAILLHESESSNPTREQRDEGEKGRTTHWRSCRTVQELRKVGVSFKPSATGSFTDISFKPGGFGAVGCLQLPAIMLNTSTMKTFLNLIAFESSNNIDELGVISYLCFMDSLIGSEVDVKELQAAGILHNSIGETKDVVQFFNTVCSNVMPHPSYRDVRQQIEEHVNGQGYKSGWRRLYVEFIQNYFSSPWSCIALIAAIIGLSLTAIQTYSSLYPRQSTI